MIDLKKLKSRILSESYPSPQNMLAAITAAIFIIEALVMVLFMYVPPLPPLAESLLDAASLTAVILPILFFFYYRPFVRYINDLKNAEEDLLRFATAIDQGLDDIMITGVDGTIVYVNPSFTATTGFTWSDAVGHDVRILDSGSKYSDSFRRIWATAAAGDEWRAEVINKKRNGETYHCRLRISPVRDATGMVTNYVYVGQDISDEKQAQAEKENYLHALEELSKYNENLIEKAPVGAWIINFYELAEEDRANDPLYRWHSQIGVKVITERVNDRMAEMLGRTKEEMRGTSIFDPRYIDPENAQMYVDELLRRRQGQKGSYELTLAGKAGNPVNVQIEAMPTKTDFRTGRVTQSLGMFLDLTERKKAELVREALITDLNRANDELKDFAYIVSHDLKAPLRAIGSLAEWIYKDYGAVLDADGRENLELLLGRTKRLNNLIEGILRYSRAGRLKPELEALDSERIATIVIDAVAPPPHITVRVDGALPKVIYDRTHLEQVMQNLIGNAIKHHGKDQGNVTLSCRDTGDFWEFCVRDDGQGIEEKHYDRIFKIFQSLKARDEVESTGIGLTLVKKIVERYGGKVWVKSTVGAGSEFYFTIPKAPSNVGDETAKAHLKGLIDIEGDAL